VTIEQANGSSSEEKPKRPCHTRVIQEKAVGID
jgi:hypothetical protein